MVYLIRPEVTAFGEALELDKLPSLNREELAMADLDGEVFWNSEPSGKPGWARFIEDGLQTELDLFKSASHAAVLFVRVRDSQGQRRILAITFGHGGRHLLRKDSYELDFGLKVTVNTVDHDKLKSIETKTFNENVFTTLKQSGREASLGLFGLTSGQELLAAVAGIPRDKQFASMVAGKDALVFRGKIDMQGLGPKCRAFLDAYEATDYQEHFGWIDSFKRVRDGGTIAWLNEQLVARLRQRAADGVVLAAPDVVDWNGPHHYRIRHAGAFTDRLVAPTIRDFYDFIHHSAGLELDDLKEHVLVMVDEDTPSEQSWTLYDSLTFEFHEGGTLFVLHGGLWYRVDQTLTRTIDGELQQIPTHGLDLPTAGTQENEGPYNFRAAKDAKTQRLACLDKKLVKCVEARTPIEPCDLFSENRDIVHVKDMSQSSKMSHLFNQATASARALQLDSGFRDGFRGRIAEDGRVDPALLPDHIRPGDFQIVLAIMTPPREHWPISLPFLTKFGIWECMRTLRTQGYRVAVQQIERRDTATLVSTEMEHTVEVLEETQ